MELLKNQGYTNKTYFDKNNNQFIKIKSYDEFNHKIDYKILNSLPFNPLVIKNDKESLITEWIDGKQLNPSTLTNEQLKIIGKNLIMLHNSKLSFTKENQLSRRFKIYLQKISSLNKKVPTINKYYKKILKIKDEGKDGLKGSIGTSATQASIISGLLKRGYLEEKEKNIYSTKLARDFLKILPETLKTPDSTAIWWLVQEEIKAGNAKIEDLTLRVLEEVKNIINGYKEKEINES